MTISEQERHTLHQTLDELMGTDVAATAMELLPPVGWGDLATKHDLAELEDRLTTRFDAALTELRSELHTEISGLREDVHTEISGLRAEFQRDLRTEIGGLRSELHGSLQSMTRTYVLGNVGLVFTVAAIAFGAAQLV